MKFLNVLSLTREVNDWLANSSHARILHVFDHACNLINEHREVLAIVTQHIGKGPFNLVVGDDISFAEHLNVDSPVTVQDNGVYLGSLTINTVGAELWSPRPDWESLHAKREEILDQIIQLPISQFSNSLSFSLATADLPSSLAAAKQLAGLGIGLTPAGDDFIMGAIYAAWIMHPLEIARLLAREVASAAAPLTTSLSAAWLKSAGKGDAGILWHEFFETLVSVGRTLAPYASAGVGNPTYAMNNILAVGATSGADALSGFISSFVCDEVNIQHG